LQAMNSQDRRIRLIRLEASEYPIGLSIEVPTKGVAILDVTVGSWRSRVPLHWRAGNWSKPPLDVALSPDGELESIQLVLQDEAVNASDECLPALRHQEEAGRPAFDVDGWPPNRYFDVHTDVR